MFITCLRKFYKRTIKSLYKPNSFILEYNINPDIIGPIILLVLYFTLGFLLKLITLQNFNRESIFLSAIQGMLNLMDALISVGLILFTINIIKVEVKTKKDFGMFLYSISVKVISYAIAIIIALIFLIPYNYRITLSYVIIYIAIFWALLLQTYYMNKAKNIKFITASFIALSAWLFSNLISQIIAYEISLL